MKKYSLAFFTLTVSLIVFFSCTKINEATNLGGDLIPPVDNVNTFEVALDALTDNKIFQDTTAASFYDNVAIGHINDPEFGITHGDAYFNIGRQTYGSYPFIDVKDSITSIDSVILSLSYEDGYGDTTGLAAPPLTVRVFELSPSSGFDDTTFYQYRNTPDFATTGGALGSRTFTHKELKDSVRVIRPSDTSTVVNVLRIKLNNSLGQRFRDLDSNQYKSDTAFKNAFKGFAIKADATGNSLAYFNFSDNSNTKLVIYYKAQFNGKDSTFSTEFYHLPIVPSTLFRNPANYRNGQANRIVWTPQGNAATVLNNTNANDESLYIKSAPGSYASILIPALATFENKVIHRAEIVVTRIPAAMDAIFTPPSRLLLDRKRNDTAFMFENDLILGADGSIGYDVFGGDLRGDQTYRFNITRYVQAIVTRHNPTDTLRLYAPLRSTMFDVNRNSQVSIPVNGNIAKGRVVVAGGNFPANPASRLRLRIIYSNL